MKVKCEKLQNQRWVIDPIHECQFTEFEYGNLVSILRQNIWKFQKCSQKFQKHHIFQAYFKYSIINCCELILNMYRKASSSALDFWILWALFINPRLIIKWIYFCFNLKNLKKLKNQIQKCSLDPSGVTLEQRFPTGAPRCPSAPRGGSKGTAETFE